MRFHLLCLLLFTAGCKSSGTTPDDSGVDVGCGHVVSADDLTLHLVGMYGSHGAFALDVAANGSFSGQLPDANLRCEGTVSATERSDLVSTADSASLFCRADRIDCGADRDYTYEDITVGTADLSRGNRFCFADCFSTPDEPMRAFLVAARAPLNRVYEAGGCTPSPYSPPALTDRCPAAP